MFSCVVDISDLHYKFMYSSLLWPTGVRSFLGPGSGMGNLTGLEIGEGGGGTGLSGGYHGTVFALAVNYVEQWYDRIRVLREAIDLRIFSVISFSFVGS